MRLTLETAGPGTSVQDGGRPGWQRYGLAPSGAMDALALAAANALVGNEVPAAAIEVGPLGLSISAHGGRARVALCGGRRPSEIAGQPIPMERSVTLEDGDRLAIGVAREGVFSYLAVQGGLRGVPQFGSFSVNARAGLGAPFPRPLRPGDAIDVLPAKTGIESAIDLPTFAEGPIRVVLGPQDDEFEDLSAFLDAEWRVSAVSDRMGYRLEGPKIVHRYGHNIVSDGTVNGSIQVPGAGQPIVLMPDRGTSGGYPKIATVISADLRRLAQTQPGRSFRFRAVSVHEAQAAYREMIALIASLPGRIRSAEASRLDLAALLSANVAGSAISALEP